MVVVDLESKVTRRVPGLPPQSLKKAIDAVGAVAASLHLPSHLSKLWQQPGVLPFAGFPLGHQLAAWLGVTE